MEKYIPKSALVSEIESLRRTTFTNFDEGVNFTVQTLLETLNTLEVKEVDLDFQRFAKEMDAIFALPSSETENTEENPFNWEYAIAKHFFELGMSVSNNAQKEEIV